ncbi:Hydrogenase 2 accessory protein HybG [Paenibacillus sophorae]|uniref:Hydrogenase 2 accessory protein HybG n=1 Tax=Paenibacillus sophorae TaxID=1333845 RepID=A0A1H8QWI8_9BACL|nr:HypC/HybG/HupF family hydrogenase formation chaperone [Paenibacillus sophorae]QWU14866.1 HypC/HybG/HupF family hydrogenase formation chaperone [Paenibacillus sophorae]SEO58680.1 Hydrogenase 2 accessory protein HybG [Paenibacillus sophorae]
MCLAIPGEVTSVSGDRAVIDITGIRREVSIALVDRVNVGDYLLVHAGCAIAIIDKQEAVDTLELLHQLAGNIHD